MTAAELCRRAGISYRQMDYWNRLGYFGDPGKGSGFARSFTDEDARTALVVAGLYGLATSGPDGARVKRDVIPKVVERVRNGERGMIEVAPHLFLDVDGLLASGA